MFDTNKEMTMNYKGITLLQIDYFLAVAKYLSFTEAAHRLFTSQPSLSRQIAQMEEKLGVALFLRTKRDVRLTPAGVVLFNEIGGVMSKIEIALKKSMELSMDEPVCLKIGFYATMDTSLYLNELIQQFRETHPQVDIIFEKHSFRNLKERLDSGELDIIFTLSFEVDRSEDVIWSTVIQQKGCILMSRKHPLSHSASLSFEDLKNETFVLLAREESPNAYDGIIAKCKKSGFVPKKVIQTPNVESLLLSVESGLGVAIIDQQIRIFSKENFRLFEIEDDPLSVVMAWKKTNLNPAVSMMNHYILNHILETPCHGSHK